MYKQGNMIQKVHKSSGYQIRLAKATLTKLNKLKIIPKYMQNIVEESIIIFNRSIS